MRHASSAGPLTDTARSTTARTTLSSGWACTQWSVVTTGPSAIPEAGSTPSENTLAGNTRNVIFRTPTPAPIRPLNLLATTDAPSPVLVHCIDLLLHGPCYSQRKLSSVGDSTDRSQVGQNSVVSSSVPHSRCRGPES